MLDCLQAREARIYEAGWTRMEASAATSRALPRSLRTLCIRARAPSSSSTNRCLQVPASQGATPSLLALQMPARITASDGGTRAPLAWITCACQLARQLLQVPASLHPRDPPPISGSLPLLVCIMMLLQPAGNSSPLRRLSSRKCLQFACKGEGVSHRGRRQPYDVACRASDRMKHAVVSQLLHTSQVVTSSHCRAGGMPIKVAPPALTPKP